MSSCSPISYCWQPEALKGGAFSVSPRTLGSASCLPASLLSTPWGAPLFSVLLTDYSFRALQVSEKACCPEAHRDCHVQEDAWHCWCQWTAHQEPCQGPPVHSMEMALWGNCCSPWGCGSVCGHCCQKLKAWTDGCCLLPAWAPLYLPTPGLHLPCPFPVPKPDMPQLIYHLGSDLELGQSL